MLSTRAQPLAARCVLTPASKHVDKAVGLKTDTPAGDNMWLDPVSGRYKPA